MLKTDGELVRQVLQGQRTACDDLVRRWSARILAFCHARVSNHHAAEDLAQEALLRGLRQRGALIVEATPESLASGVVDRYLEVKERGLI